MDYITKKKQVLEREINKKSGDPRTNPFCHQPAMSISIMS